MILIKRILLGLLIATFISCSSSATQENGSTMDNDYRSNISLFNGKNIIDTTAILKNNNLQQLIEGIEKADFIEKNTVAEIPSFIKLFLDSLTNGFSIANPGEEWQVGCTPQLEVDTLTGKKHYDPKVGDTITTYSIRNKKVPTRQLIYFGINKQLALITYYTGGIAKCEHALLFKFDNTKLVDFWCGNIGVDLKYKTEILEYLKDNINKDWVLNTNVIYL